MGLLLTHLMNIFGVSWAQYKRGTDTDIFFYSGENMVALFMSNMWYLSNIIMHLWLQKHMLCSIDHYQYTQLCYVGLNDPFEYRVRREANL